MSLIEFLKSQQKIQDAFLPPAVKSLLDTQKKMQEFLPPPAVQEFLETQKKWNSFFEFNQIKDFQPVDFLNTDIYLKAFGAIESINKQNAINESISSGLKYSYAKYDFLNFAEDIAEEEAEEIEIVIVKETKSIKRIITDIYRDNSNLLKIEPRQFEEMIAELLDSKGYKVELTKQTRDNGYDIIALAMFENELPLKFLVECKRYKENKVGVDIIRSFKEVIQTEKANKGIIVTTSYFTKDANKKRLESPYLLEYKDKDDVLNWVSQYCNR